MELTPPDDLRWIHHTYANEINERNQMNGIRLDNDTCYMVSALQILKDTNPPNQRESKPEHRPATRTHKHAEKPEYWPGKTLHAILDIIEWNSMGGANNTPSDYKP